MISNYFLRLIKKTITNGMIANTGILNVKWEGGYSYDYYHCTMRKDVGYIPEGCVSYVRKERVDSEVWKRVENFLSTPGLLEDAIQNQIEDLQSQEGDAAEECEKLEIELDNLLLERQKVVTWARKEFITEDDLQTRLIALSFQGNALRRELSEKRLLVGNSAERLSMLAELFRARVQLGWEAAVVRIRTDMTPETLEQAELQFQARRKVIEVLVERVEVDGDKNVKVKAAFECNDDCVSVTPYHYTTGQGKTQNR